MVCKDLCQQVAEANIINISFETSLLRCGRVLKSIIFVFYQRNLFKVSQSCVSLATSADDFMFYDDCFDENTSWDGMQLG